MDASAAKLPHPPDPTIEISEERVRFERGLLAFLRDATDRSALSEMLSAVSSIESIPKTGQQRAFWWIAKAFFEAIEAGTLPIDAAAKKFAARANMQIRLIADEDAPIPEQLFGEALGLIARAQPVTRHVEEVQRMYQLDRMLSAPPSAIPPSAAPRGTDEDRRAIPSGSSMSSSQQGERRAGSAAVPMSLGHPARSEDLRKIGSLSISLPAYNAYLAEADEWMRVLAGDFGEWRHELHRGGSRAALDAARSLARSSAEIGFEAARGLSGAIQAVLEVSAARPVSIEPEDIEILVFAVDSLRAMLHRFAAQILPEPDVTRVAALVELNRRWKLLGQTPG